MNGSAGMNVKHNTTGGGRLGGWVSEGRGGGKNERMSKGGKDGKKGWM